MSQDKLIQWTTSDPDILIFCTAAHPTTPIIYIGLSNGYLYCYEYDTTKLDRAEPECTIGEETQGVTLKWKTRRHKDSIRSIACNDDVVVSVGKDKVVKMAKFDTGMVTAKGKVDGDATCMRIVNDWIVLGNEQSNVEILSLTDLSKVNQLNNLHGGDPVNDLLQFQNRSRYRFISMGQTTVSHWNGKPIEKKKKKQESENNKVHTSDDQEDEILCGCFIDNETFCCGMGNGVITIWKPERNDLQDQLTRVKVAKDESVESIISTMQDDGCLWCGCSNGKVYKINVKKSKIMETRVQDEMDEITYMDLDFEYRLISGGMESIVLWCLDEEKENAKDDENDKDEQDELSSSSEDEQFSDSDISVSSDDNESDSDSDNNSNNNSNNDSDNDSDNDSVSNLEDSDDENEETLTGLSREELIAELSKDDEEKPPAQKKRKTVKNEKKDKSRQNYLNHGINKFEDL